MANNWMFLVNKRTGDRVRVAKYYPSTGWYCVGDLDDAFDRADFGHLTKEQQIENSKHIGFGVPYPSPAGMYGDEWVLEYETATDPSSENVNSK